ncbi:hypothetical protein DM02DRAFT_678036 [Periconia macrospinosa]|uniref:BZIP domain-containing protein n=1 Tax=Periconia macrospinosa TaxID=97972 RepID=A0A2V1D0H2_9PLEO|nr:hypothetical protein DM02DRAFT_678036 [Periconia macrospinosa]
METLAPPPHYQRELGMAMPFEMPNLFSSPNEWGNHSHIFAKWPNANYLKLSIPDLYNSRRQHALEHGTNDAKNSHAPAIETAVPTYDGELDQASEAAQRFNTLLNIHACQPAFTALNTHNPGLQSHKTDPASPLQTSFDPSLNSSLGFSADIAANSATSSTPGPINEPSSNKHRHHSTWTGGSGSWEQVEPGSARAIYLEKNRKAASKWRGKQKMQQQKLMETAREMERMNKQLKAEVESLKSDMHDLMMIVGQHSDCPDGRLKTYVQAAADRLSSRDHIKGSLLSVAASTSPEMPSSNHFSDHHSSE